MEKYVMNVRSGLEYELICCLKSETHKRGC